MLLAPRPSARLRAAPLRISDAGAVLSDVPHIARCDGI